MNQKYDNLLYECSTPTIFRYRNNSEETTINLACCYYDYLRTKRTTQNIVIAYLTFLPISNVGNKITFVMCIPLK